MITIKKLAEMLSNRINEAKIVVAIPDVKIRKNVELIFKVLYKASLLSRDDTRLWDDRLEDFEMDERFAGLRLVQEVLVNSDRKFRNLKEPYKWAEDDVLAEDKEFLSEPVTPADFRRAQDVVLAAFKVKQRNFVSGITEPVVALEQALLNTGYDGRLTSIKLDALPVYVKHADEMLEDWEFGAAEEKLIREYFVNVVVPKFQDQTVLRRATGDPTMSKKANS